MIKPLKKGTHIWFVKAYGECAGTVYEEMVVDSWGAQRAYFRRLDGTTKRQEYSTRLLNDHPRNAYVFEVGAVDIEAKALEIDALAIQYEITALEERLTRTNEDVACKTRVTAQLTAARTATPKAKLVTRA